MVERSSYDKRADEIADTTRRVLIAFNTGGIGVAFAIAGSLVNNGIHPAWTVSPVGMFAGGLVISAASLFLAKHKALQRGKAEAGERAWPDYAAWYWANYTYDILTLLFFVVGVFAGLWRLSLVSIT